METNDKIRNLWLRFLNIFRNVAHKSKYRLVASVSAIIIIIFFVWRRPFVVVPLIITAYYLSDVRYWNHYYNAMDSIGLKTVGNRYPLLINREENGEFLKLTFTNPGFELKEIEEIKEKFGNSLGITIGDVQLKERKIVLEAYNGFFDYSETIFWDDKYLTEDERVIVGKSIGKNVYWNFVQLPHMLIGGSTGSGKSMLFKSIMHQMIKKDFEVNIFDLKFGVDYSNGWQEHCVVITDKQEALKKLESICEELERRGRILKDANCSTLSEYNRKNGNKMKRIIVGCDEAATMLSKLNNDKKLVEAMEAYLIKIAQLGRAFGIHLVLATQRPSADYITGEIKNNIDYRLCGHGDITLSKLVLDNGDASKLPKNISGVFINHNGTKIKGFFIDEDLLKGGGYQK